LITKDTVATVWGTVTDSTSVTVTVNGTPVPLDPDTFKTTVNLVEGLNTITIVATDAAGNTTTVTRTITRDTIPPTLTISSPSDSTVTNQNAVQISGTVSDSTSVTLTANGQNVTVSNGTFSTSVSLTEGISTITIVATDAAGNTTTINRIIGMYTITPVITIQSPQNNSTVSDSAVTVSGMVQDSTKATVTINGNTVPVNSDGSFSITVPLAAGANQIMISATDAAGNTSSNQVSIMRSSIVLPPDPVTVAPKIDPTVVTTVETATSFLYTGPHPIQTGVDTSMMSYVRAAVIRGRVLSRNNQPLPGVTVSILNHPEFGQTLSRADGMYDMAINGGGQLTVNFAMNGYLTAQRQVNTLWQSYAHVEDVALVQLDTNVTVVKLGDSVSVARGSVVTDQDGTRQATLMFKPGTQATMKIVHYTYQQSVLGDSTQLVKVPTDTESVPLSMLSVRATEYTVGPNGPQSMPAALPPTSAYTYCVELSSDEAIDSGASTVDFSQPVPFYVDNFLNFPVGVAVPTGYYDESKGQWIGLNDGVVIKILSTAGGIASVSMDSSGATAESAILDSAGIDSLELTKLASLYQPGQTLWRLQLNHFSKVDANWAYLIDGDGSGDTIKIDNRNQKNILCHTTDSTGSIIGIQDQSLGQSLNIAGTPFTLNYNSSNTPGYKQANVLTLPLSGDTLPQGLQSIVLKVNVAGQEFDSTFIPSPNLMYKYIWNGEDAYGRSLNGEQPVTANIGYTYKLSYYALNRTSSWNLVHFGEMIGEWTLDTTREEGTVWTEWDGYVGVYDKQSEGTGGWSLDVHNSYDPIGNKMYYGNGEVRDGTNLIDTTDIYDYSPINGGGFCAPFMAIGPDGTFYYSQLVGWDSEATQVWKRCPDGSVALVAGSGSQEYSNGQSTSGVYPWCPFEVNEYSGWGGREFNWHSQSSGDGGPATDAALNMVTGLALGSDGSLYIADAGNNCIRRVDPSGIINTYAGTGACGFSGDSGLAVNAQLNCPLGIAIGPDGSLYISDEGNERVRKVSPAGIITTIAGNGQQSATGDGGPAAQASLDPYGLDVDTRGNIYVADAYDCTVRKITPNGIITTIAGNGNSCTPGDFGGDGGPATSAELSSPGNVTVGRDGSVYIDDGGGWIRRVSSNGIITTIANMVTSWDPDWYGGVLWSRVFPSSSAIGPDGNFYFLGSLVYPGGYWAMYSSIEKMSPAIPGVSLGETSIASEDGSQVYVFGANCKHLQTVDALTNVTLYSFTYDSLGLLAAVTDRDSLVTTIQRDASENPLAIISPYGQRTILNVDTTGYLTSVIDPAGDTTRYTHTTDGLMTSFNDARGNTHSFTYDSLGRLIMDRDPAGGYKILTRADNSNGYSVTVQTALGGRSIHTVSALATGGQLMTTTDASGLTDTTTTNFMGTWYTKTHDGTITRTIQGPDPRFGMQAPVTASMTVTTPDSLQSLTQESRTVSEMVGLQIGQFTDNVTVNGRAYQSVYTGGGGYSTNGDTVSGFFTITSPQGRQSFTYIDTLGRVIEDSIPGVVPVNYYYDGKGRLTSVAQGARISYFTYDSLGRIALAKDPIGNTSGFAYDSVGRVTVQTLPDGRVITFTYDANGNLITLTPPGRPEHMFDYDVNDLTDKYTPPFAGDSIRATNYSYDLDKRLVTTNLPDGRNITITYDTAGCGCGGTADRIHSIGFDRGTQTFAYDSVGNLSLSVTPEHDSLHYIYDGSLPYSTYSSGSVNGNVHYYFDNNFWLNALQLNYSGTDSLRNIFGYDYDGDGLLTGIYQPTDENWNSDDAHYLTINRDFQTGNITSTSIGNVSTEQTYDNYGGLASYEADYGSSPMFQTTYSRDSLGRITSLYETIGGVSKEMDYGYDAVGRLTSVWRNDTLVSQYVYDANGNRIAHITPTQIDSGRYDAQDRMLSYAGAQYIYGRNGDLQTKISSTDTTRYTYDAFGNLLQVVMPKGDLIQYVIDGQNRRIARKLNGRITNKWLYAGQLTPVAEFDSADNIIARFSGGYMNKRDTIYQIITDHLGSPRLVVNVATGAVVQTIDYDEFGNVIYDSNPGFQPFGFAGGLYDHDTKLVRFGARDYDPATARWLTKDELLFKGGASNLYEYALGDGVNVVDKNGKQGLVLAGAETGAAIGTAVEPGGGTVVGMAVGIVVGVAATVATVVAVESATEASNEPAVPVYRVYGGASPLYGQSWTTMNPCMAQDYRSQAGLPNSNSGEYMATGYLINQTGVTYTTAGALYPWQQGGWPEAIVLYPQQQIIITNTTKLSHPY
jgi:RHS repeat-associated protein